jgi:hypothetical protein
MIRRLLLMLAFVAVCVLEGGAASWASVTPTPMPSPYGVADVWTCQDREPDPAATPPVVSGSDCAVTSWATPAAAPTPEPVAGYTGPTADEFGELRERVTYGAVLLVFLASAGFVLSWGRSK